MKGKARSLTPGGAHQPENIAREVVERLGDDIKDRIDLWLDS
jgi:hypothetical protein